MDKCYMCGKPTKGFPLGHPFFCSPECLSNYQLSQDQQDEADAQNATRQQSPNFTTSPTEKTGCFLVTLIKAAVGLFLLMIVASLFTKPTHEGQKAGHNKPKSHNASPTLPLPQKATPKSPVAETPENLKSEKVPSVTANDSSPEMKRPSGISSDFIQITSTDGRTIWAKFLTQTPTEVFVRRTDGAEFEIPFARLTSETKDRIEQYRATKRNRKTSAHPE